MKEINMDYCDQTIVSIEPVHNRKCIHYLGYGYYVGDPDNKPCRFLEYSGLIVSLEEALKIGIKEYEEKYQEFCNQYIMDVTEDEVNDIYEHYNNGEKPVEIDVNKIDINTPNGMYIVDMHY